MNGLKGRLTYQFGDEPAGLAGPTHAPQPSVKQRSTARISGVNNDECSNDRYRDQRFGDLLFWSVLFLWYADAQHTRTDKACIAIGKLCIFDLGGKAVPKLIHRDLRRRLTASISLVCGQLFSLLFFFDFHRTNFSRPFGLHENILDNRGASAWPVPR
jgi:hypothetical protein